jgi:hypothetical protein
MQIDNRPLRSSLSSAIAVSLWRGGADFDGVIAQSAATSIAE